MNTTTLSRLSLGFLSLLGSVATSVAGASDADLFYTSFEVEESPSYSPGKLYGINGWKPAGTRVVTAAEIITDDSGTSLKCPDGRQMLKLSNVRDDAGNPGGSPYADLLFTSPAAPAIFYFSGLTAYSGSLSESTGVISRFYLSNTVKDQSFMGVSFGIWQDQGRLAFFYLKEPNGVAVSLGETSPQENTFYRFEVDVDVAAKSYRIRVYDHSSHELLASAEDGRFRNGTAIEINNLRLNNLCHPADRGDDFSTYYDQLRVSSSPFPEP